MFQNKPPPPPPPPKVLSLSLLVLFRVNTHTTVIVADFHLELDFCLSKQFQVLIHVEEACV